MWIFFRLVNTKRITVEVGKPFSLLLDILLVFFRRGRLRCTPPWRACRRQLSGASAPPPGDPLGGGSRFWRLKRIAAGAPPSVALWGVKSVVLLSLLVWYTLILQQCMLCSGLYKLILISSDWWLGDVYSKKGLGFIRPGGSQPDVLLSDDITHCYLTLLNIKYIYSLTLCTDIYIKSNHDLT